MRRPIAIAVVIAALVAAISADRLGAPDPRLSAPVARSATAGPVVRVVDGDTIHVELAGGREKVRYIGIDTPETHRPGTPVQCFGRAASAANARLVAGERVRLVSDVEPRDRYGRLLAYVYRLRDGRFVNESLVRDGYALSLTIPPNVRFAERFLRLAREARGARRGLWAACRT